MESNPSCPVTVQFPILQNVWISICPSSTAAAAEIFYSFPIPAAAEIFYSFPIPAAV